MKRTTTSKDLDATARLVNADPYLAPYRRVLERRRAHARRTAKRLTGTHRRLADMAQGHRYFGLHRQDDGWTLREWAPNATAVYLVGDMTGWRIDPALALMRIDDRGVWQLELPADRLGHGDLFRFRIQWPGGEGDRIPAYARRVVQDPDTHIFNAQVWQPDTPYTWRHPGFTVSKDPPLIYEVHAGMAQEAARVGTWAELSANVLPRVAAAGYNMLQLMAVAEHPYYASFGYHVSSFFAPSSRFGSAEDLKALIDNAHGHGIAVIMDLIHSHAVNNAVEGLSQFDGTDYQYFHAGPRGRHTAWDSRCFDYGKTEVLHFLLSNCRYWLEEFHVDGFRFDGVTSMLYAHHGLEKAFTRYDDYFGPDVDEDALAYLSLANQVIHEIRPDAVTIAEDVSGMPALAVDSQNGGCGFDYRFAMGVPDFWVKLTKDMRDEDWPMGHLWHELTNRRREEKTISYAESHDQALVGDQTLMFRLLGADIYQHMTADDPHLRADRAVALHKMIRLITLATAASGYLNFMGNEFGHPEWIDFPREGNNWSYQYARRQWHLADDPGLKYHWLYRFDQDMTAMARQYRLLDANDPSLLWEHNDDKILIFERAGLVLAFNFHPTRSYTDYHFNAPAGTWTVALDSDARAYGGHGRIDDRLHYVSAKSSRQAGCQLSLYLPARTALVLAAT